ncbi:hypothetical protein [Cupriavidus pauculus]|uniref:hypothetical protein n=1 Tax=Cupriavidus pauculus TaxID=82633 RepID=UPI001D0C3B4E|nr:hypothetical protein [Cupriavidus pauculus]
MQRKYGIGEVLIFQRGENEPERNETECTVDCYMNFRINPQTMLREEGLLGYGVQFADGALRFALETQLRRRPPKDTPSSWEAMKDVWSPHTVEA